MLVSTRGVNQKMYFWNASNIDHRLRLDFEMGRNHPELFFPGAWHSRGRNLISIQARHILCPVTEDAAWPQLQGEVVTYFSSYRKTRRLDNKYAFNG
jgi:hypothetical protein